MPNYNNFGNGYYPQYPSYTPNNAYGVPVYQNNAQNPYSGSQSYEPRQQDTVVNWVQGKSGAEAYPLAPGQRAMLMDSNDPVLYVKATDTSGRYMPLQSYRLVPMEETSASQALPQEAIDYDKIRAIISEEVNKRLNGNNKKEGNK